MAESKKRKGSRKYKPKGGRGNSTGPSYKDGVDHSNSRFHKTNSKGFGNVNVNQKRGHLGK